MKTFLTASISFVILVALYAALPPLGREPLPRLGSLKGFERVGCGNSGWNSKGSTGQLILPHTRGPLIADGLLRRQIDIEASALGFRREESSSFVSYRKASHSLLERRSQWVRISKQGHVVTGSSISKWPFL